MGLFVMALACAPPAFAQLARTNAIWARTAPVGSITFDGNLNDPVWAQAESKVIRFGVNSGLPGSGYILNASSPFPPFDTTTATIKFLVIQNKLYMGFNVQDNSIGGSGQFNRFDGFLMGLKDHAALGFPKPINEYLYSWWYPREAGKSFSQCNPDSAAGNFPTFKGRWGANPVCDSLTGLVATRRDAQIAAWDARIVVNGTSNTDATPDVGYTAEMVFDLGVMGYDATKAAGDTIEWNISLYDQDHFWASSPDPLFFSTRTWWENPWGLDMFFDEVRIYTRPSVTTSSGALPSIDPDFRMPITGSPAPTIDGNLNDAVWAAAPSFDIRWNDDVLRGNYPSIGKYRSGQYQPRLSVNPVEPNPLPFVANGGDATVKYFWKGDFLYMGFDVRDGRVQSNATEDEWDGLNVSITHRTETDPLDISTPQGKGLAFHVGATGNAVPIEDLPPLISDGTAQVGLLLKAGTTVDSTGMTTSDQGYTAELKVDLKALGYPPGLGDHTMFLGVTLYDHDRFSNPLSSSYSTRTWWFRERKETCCPAWTLLDGTYIIGSTTGVGGDIAAAGFQSLGNSPNPFRHMTNLAFALGRESEVSLALYDVNGRIVSERSLGRFAAGHQQVAVQLPQGKSGVYLYRLRAHDPASGAVVATMTGKMMHLR